MKFAENVHKLRKSRNLTLEELAEGINRHCGTKYSKGTVSRWESGTDPTMDSVRNVAAFFGVSLDDILGLEYSKDDVSSVDALIPVLGVISAGVPLYAEQNVIGYTAAPPFKRSVNRRLFYLRVKGDSMDREFPAGSEVLVDRDAEVRSGDIAVVLVNGFDATVKKVKFETDAIVLIPLSNNDEHYAQRYDLAETEVTLVGRVIGAFKNY